MTDSTDEKQKPAHLFKPGQSGNPKGRPKGSRNRLGEQFVADLQADWEVNGAVAIATVREERPQDYLKVVASILPKEHVVHRPTDEMTDEELAERLGVINDLIAYVEGLEGTPKRNHEGNGPSGKPQ